VRADQLEQRAAARRVRRPDLHEPARVADRELRAVGREGERADLAGARGADRARELRERVGLEEQRAAVCAADREQPAVGRPRERERRRAHGAHAAHRACARVPEADLRAAEVRRAGG
jgi:hypothetical protein